MSVLSVFPERTFQVGDEILVIRPLSWAELGAVDELVASVLEKMGEEGVSYLTLAKTAAQEILVLLAHKTGKPVSWFNELPAYLVAEMIAAFLEINQFENFFQSVTRGLEVGNQILSSLSSGSSPTATPTGTSGRPTPSGKSKGSQKR